MFYPKTENFQKHGIYSATDLIRDYERKTNGYFFRKDTMTFFKSRVSDKVYPGARIIYFITSEKFDHLNPRKYTLRFYRPVDGLIDTIGEFQSYNTMTAAARAAIKLLINEDKNEAV